jgi:predicted signal transduction protein with EAL and GGDEF domain
VGLVLVVGACIFPQVGTDTIHVIVDKLVLFLNSEMRKNKWPVSFSIGALTCKNIQNQTVDSVMSKADLTMYKAKHTGKNKVCYDLLDDYVQEDHPYNHSVNTSLSVIGTSKQKTPTTLRVVE